MKYSRKQLESLKTDIDKGNVQEKFLPGYTKTEADAVNSLKQQVMISVIGAKDKLKLFDSLDPKAIKVIEKLKKNGKTKNV